MGDLQAVEEMGAQVRKREQCAHVVFWMFFDRDQPTDSEGETSKAGKIPMAKDYWIFNADQVDGYTKSEAQPASRAERIEQAESFFQALGLQRSQEETVNTIPPTRMQFTCRRSKRLRNRSSIIQFCLTRPLIGQGHHID